MPLPLTLAAAKAQCRIPLADTAEDALLGSYLIAAGAVFEQLSKRSLTAVPVTTAGVTTAGPEVLSANEQAIAEQWLKLVVAHFYESRQPVITDVRQVSVEVPMTVDFLMDLLRTPTL